MTLGQGIFWSTVLVVITFAVHQISVRRKWRTAGKFIGACLFALFLVAASTWGWFAYQNRLQVATELDGISLGMTPLEVRLAKGAPTSEIERDADKLVFYYRPGSGSETLIFFSKDLGQLRATQICIIQGYERVLGFGPGSSEKHIVKRLGKPDETSINIDATSKLISFRRWNVSYTIERGRVQDVCISDSEFIRFANEHSPSTKRNQQ